MPDYRQHYEVSASVGQFTDAMNKAANGAEGFEESLEDLNSLGVNTTQQFQDQFDKIERLTGAFKDDDLATQGLILRKEELIQKVRSLDEATRNQARSTKLSQFALLNTGFLIQDLSTLSQGWAFALRSVANNLDITTRTLLQLVQQEGGFRAAFKRLARDMLSPGGIVAALNLVTTAAIIAFSVFDKEKKKVDEFKKSVDEASNSLLEFQEAAGLERQVDLVRLQQGLDIAKERIDQEKRIAEQGERRQSQAERLLALESRLRKVGQDAEADAIKAQRALLAGGEDAALLDEERVKQASELAETLEAQVEVIQKIVDQEKIRLQVAEALDAAGLTGITRLIGELRVLERANRDLQEQLEAREKGGASILALQRQIKRERQEEVRVTDAESDLVERIRNLWREIGIARRDAALQFRNDLLDMRVEITLQRDLLQRISGIDGERIIKARLLLDILERQVQAQEELNRARFAPSRLDPAGRDTSNRVVGVSGEDEFDPLRQQTFLERIGADTDRRMSGGFANEQRAHFLGILSNPRMLADETIAEFDRIQESSISAGDQLALVWNAWTSDAYFALQDLTEKTLSDIDMAVQSTAGQLANAFETNFRTSQQKANEAFREGNLARGRELEQEARRQLQVYKTFAIAEALANTFTGATRAIRDTPGGPIVKIAAAAAVTAAGIANVRRIRAIQPGSSGGGGSSRPAVYGRGTAGRLGDNGVGFFVRPRADIGPNIPFDRGSGPAPAIPIELTVVPGVMPTGEIVFSVEQGLKQRSRRGGSAELRVGGF